MLNAECRKFWRIVSAFCILHSAFACARREATKPNVLLITLDTFRADRIGPLTPNLGRLGREAVRFENAVAPVPMTLPAHAAILSGLIPLHHTVRINGAGSFPANRETLATLFVVVGDHGESLGEHGELTHGLLIFEPTLHVPMIIAAPDLRARSVRQPVGSVDLAATVAALAHLAMPAGDGRDLSDDLRRGRDPTEHDLYSESQYPLQFGWSDLAAVRRGSVKLIAGPSSKLFDVSKDPGETKDLATSDRRAYHELQATAERIRSTAVTSSTTAVDPETRAKLASLGYVAPTGAVGPSSRDPVAMAPVFASFERAMLA